MGGLLSRCVPACFCQSAVETTCEAEEDDTVLVKQRMQNDRKLEKNDPYVKTESSQSNGSSIVQTCPKPVISRNKADTISAIPSSKGTVSLEDVNVEICDVVNNLSTVLTRQSEDAILPKTHKIHEKDDNRPNKLLRLLEEINLQKIEDSKNALPMVEKTTEKNSGGSFVTQNVVTSSTTATTSTCEESSAPKQDKATMRKKLAKRVLSPFIILRTGSGEENTIETRLKKLLDMDPLYLAQELCLIDKELFLRIPWSELSVCGWMTKDKHQVSPNVMAMVEFFNRIALLVASEILYEVDTKRRVCVISKVIQVANKLRAMGNFNSLKALLGGLQCTPIYRLDKTWKELSSKRRKQYRGLTKLMSEEVNFAAYRNELDNLMDQDVPCLPFLGNFLTQIAQTQTYLACRKKESFKSTSNKNSIENYGSPTTPSPQKVQRESRQKKTPSRASYLKKRSFSIEQKYDRFSQSSPNISTSCTLTSEKSSHYCAHRLRKCRSWQHSSDSGIQIDDSNSSCFSASSFLNSNTSLGYETGEERFENLMQTNRAIFSCPRTPIPGKSAMKYNSDGGKNEYETLSGTLNIKRLSSPEIEADRNKSREVKDVWSIPDQETTDKTGPELQLWRFHLSAMQYSFPSRLHIHDFLTSTSFNSEEENYQLSLQREPLAKKRDSN